jgi:tRNA modification GTPase
VLVVLDASRPLVSGDRDLLRAGPLASAPRLAVVNKIDLPWVWNPSDELASMPFVEVSALEQRGLDALVDKTVALLGGGEATRDLPLVTNARHASLLERAGASLARSIDAIQSSSNLVSEEFILVDLQDAAAALQEVVGRRTSDDLLRHIFESFCIGK